MAKVTITLTDVEQSNEVKITADFEPEMDTQKPVMGAQHLGMCFLEWVREEEQKEKDGDEECQLPIGSDDVCGLAKNSQIHTNYRNPQRHNFVGRKPQ